MTKDDGIQIRKSIEDAILNNINYNKNAYSYDKTFIGKIVSLNNDGTYNVKINGKIYPNVSTVNGFQYSINNIVYCISPQNNMNLLKILYGEVSQIIGLPIGMIFASSVYLTDALYKRLDGQNIVIDGSYSQFAIWLQSQVSLGNAPSCTITEYASDMTDYGQCGKFVINTTSESITSGGYTVNANSIKLPTIIQFIASNNGGQTIGVAELDTFKSHNHALYGNTRTGAQSSGTYYGISYSTGDNSIGSYLGYGETNGWRIEANGDTETKPKNVRYPYYIVVANQIKLPIQVDIDQIESDISSINDTLSNVEKSEIIYDRYSTDSNINWGRRSGLNGNLTKQINSKFKRLRFYCTVFIYAATNTGGNANCFELDLRGRAVENYFQSNKTCSYRVGNSFQDPRFFTIWAEYNKNNYDFGVHFTFGSTTETDVTNYFCYRIEGVY